MDMVTLVQILNEAVGISQREMYEYNCFQSSFGYVSRQIGFVNLGMATGLEEGKLWIQIC